MHLSTAQKSDNINFQFPISKLVHTKRSKSVHTDSFQSYGWISNCEQLQKNYLE